MIRENLATRVRIARWSRYIAIIFNAFHRVNASNKNPANISKNGKKREICFLL